MQVSFIIHLISLKQLLSPLNLTEYMHNQQSPAERFTYVHATDLIGKELYSADTKTDHAISDRNHRTIQSNAMTYDQQCIKLIQTMDFNMLHNNPQEVQTVNFVNRNAAAQNAPNAVLLVA